VAITRSNQLGELKHVACEDERKADGKLERRMVRGHLAEFGNRGVWVFEQLVVADGRGLLKRTLRRTIREGS